mmetsp:Transcript_5252/g.11812  ORF Transcript_5252/g.11812 Transcript_5252/m.11812 type:complete len:208 (-) Transcript_5252:455-1078(-)
MKMGFLPILWSQPYWTPLCSRGSRSACTSSLTRTDLLGASPATLNMPSRRTPRTLPTIECREQARTRPYPCSTCMTHIIPRRRSGGTYSRKAAPLACAGGQMTRTWSFYSLRSNTSNMRRQVSMASILTSHPMASPTVRPHDIGVNLRNSPDATVFVSFRVLGLGTLTQELGLGTAAPPVTGGTASIMVPCGKVRQTSSHIPSRSGA